MASGVQVSTIAGTGTAGFADAGTGTSAQFNSAFGIAYDVNTNKIYVADILNHRIRMINLTPGANNQVSTIAGTGAAGFADAGTGTSAQFNFPYAVAYDVNTNKLYVADTGNNRIRMINLTPGANNQVSTIAGTGAAGFADSVTGTSAQFKYPQGITVNSARNRLYVADTDNHSIRMINLDTTQVLTIAGTGIAGFADAGTGTSAQFNSPTGITVNSVNSILYVADTDNNRIRMISLGFNAVSTIAGTGTAGFADSVTGTSAHFLRSRGITINSTDSILYVADTGNNRIRMINLTPGANNQVSTIAGTGIAGFADSGTGTSAQFQFPRGITINSNNSILYVENNNRIRMITL
jgi:DNA-binding beta-propeller fold protein YncE